MARMAECPGHFGHIEVAKPMFHIGIIKNVPFIMNCFHFNCSKILADEESEYNNKQEGEGRNRAKVGGEVPPPCRVPDPPDGLGVVYSQVHVAWRSAPYQAHVAAQEANLGGYR